MGYNGIEFKNSITIGKIFSIHYFEYMSDFTFEGESHNFWEFICVDKGEVGITAGSSYTVLKKGEIAFHEPNEFHNVTATGSIAPNLVVISFECSDEAMDFFRKRILKIDETARNILANIIMEARQCYDCRLDDPYLQNMPLKPEVSFGAGQMIKNYLEQFLIHMIRRYSQPVVLSKRPASLTLKTTKSKSDEEVFNRIVDYLESNITTHVTIEQICRDNLIGRSQLQKIFKDRCNLGIIEYFSHMKINAAKELIRTNHMNFTQVSEHLGYTSIHYFSRQFKKLTGMTPSEYASSIKAVAERGF
ncbi:MAG: AraC family transcriptional regulator [Lachnospiraceae bacterium]